MIIKPFRRTQRLLTAADYQRVFKKPLRSVDSSFMVLARKNSGGCARLGLAIAKKQLKRAVDRNRVKRVIRESFRQQAELLQGYDFVVLARRDTQQHYNDKLTASLERHWRKLTQPASNQPDKTNTDHQRS
ncbi:ribonuclease P protein component [Solemya velum gill symbiont]|uniref:ribonuclease P protein component n=1 Tax=Solemya velum gill symbiont TaxID=2340 RepID=UPI0009C597B5|nr:ribonuclease P protein component [Solemya velum gill symbiont]OOY70263.1 ribonuclease P protein component [Solemya velum gill symbiont]OOY92548.1 ribonuclease P protein component [Solemya velum gill symbiont]